MASSTLQSRKHYLFQVNQHVQTSAMVPSVMDGTELDFNNIIMSLSSITESNPNDCEKDLRLAAELGRYLLEQNYELKNYINILQKEIDDKQCDMKLFNAKLLSIREQLSAKCKLAEMLDATNFDLEQELALQRRENEKNRQHIKELFDLYEKTCKQCHDIKQEYDTFRAKEFSSYFDSSKANSSRQTPICLTTTPTKQRRSSSFTFKSTRKPLSSISPSESSNLFDTSTASVFKSRLSELKSCIQSLAIECNKLNEQLRLSERDKRYLMDRIVQVERHRRDDNDALQSELNRYRKLLDKYSNETAESVLLNVYSPPECALSYYDEVSLENKHPKLYCEPTNYKDLFSRVYEKLKMNINSRNNNSTNT